MEPGEPFDCIKYAVSRNKATMVTGNGTQTTQYAYNPQGQLTTLTDPLGKYESYTYDANNNLLTKTDRLGNITTNVYNLLNQLTSVTVKKSNGTAAAENMAYSYYKTGAKEQDKNENLTTDYVYDCAGRLTQQTDTTNTATVVNGDKLPAVTIVKTQAYDVRDNRTSLTITRNGVTDLTETFKPDSMNRLQYVYDNGVLQATYGYDLNGNRLSLAYANGVTTSYVYNSANLVTSLTNKLGSAVISSYTYTYKLDGNQTSKKDNMGINTAYEYDDLGRLKTETETTPAGVLGAVSSTVITKGYTYDKANNRLSMTVSTKVGTAATGYTTAYGYNVNNQLLTETQTPTSGAVVTTTYQYDLNGNQTSKTSNSQIISTAYDVFNRLLQTSSGGNVTSYRYKADGLRIAVDTKPASGSSQITIQVWDGSNIVTELDGTGNLTNKYIRGINLIKTVPASGSTNERYYIFNAHGDVIQLTDTAGNVKKNYYYDSFGNEITPPPALVLSGTQYINTGITANGLTTKIEVDYDLDTVGTNQFIFGARTGTISNTLCFLTYSSKNWRSDYCTSQTYLGSSTSGRHTIVAEGGVFSLDGTVICTYTAQSFTAGSLLSLGGVGAETASRMCGKIYNAKIWENGVLVRDFVPVKQGDTAYSSTPAPSNCMWDKVTKQYFVNQGTGSLGYESTQVDGNPFRYCGEYFDQTLSGTTSISTSVSDLCYSEYYQYWPLIRDHSIDGNTIKLNGVTYSKGLGAHANSTVTIPLSGTYTNFYSVIGIDDEVSTLGDAIFKVIADGVEIYNSGSMKPGMVKTVSLNVSGKQTLQLVTDTNGDYMNDHTDWANARLTGTDGIVTYVSDWGYTQTTNYRSVLCNVSAAFKTLTLAGKQYVKGLCAYTNSTITVPLKGSYDRFVADIGPDSNNDSTPVNMIFKVLADGVELYNSGSMTAGTVKTVDITISGKQNLQLVIQNNGGNVYCYGDWADAKLIRNGSAVTGMYYLQARYYDPTTGRFITKDPIRNGLNYYTYCRNNPVLLIDPSGLAATIVKKEDLLMAMVDKNGIVISTRPATNSDYLQFAASIVYAAGPNSSSAANFPKLLNSLINNTDGLSLSSKAHFSKLFTPSYISNYFANLKPLTKLMKYATDSGGGGGYAFGIGFGVSFGDELPEEMPVSSEISEAVASEYKAAEAANWIKPDGSTWWPLYDGFEGTPEMTVLEPGMRIDRYGYDGGSYVSPEGISYSSRSLAPGTEIKPYNVFEVVQPTYALGGKIAPWFNQPGGGMQYKLYGTVQDLLDGGYIRRVSP